MNRTRLRRIILIMLVMALVACSGIGQESVDRTKPEGSPITIKGKIDYMKNLGGYFVLGDVPAREYLIVNQDVKLLEVLHKSAKIVMIEGRIVQGAEYLFIEKIDGQPYRGKL